MFIKKAKNKHCDSSFSVTGGRQKIAKPNGNKVWRTSGEDKENHTMKHFQINHRRRSWPPKEACTEAAAGYHFFFNNNNSDKESSQRRSSHFTASGFYIGDDSEMENLLSEINKSEIRSRVKERIEGFENFKVCLHLRLIVD